jgi:hypothetical protein
MVVHRAALAVGAQHIDRHALHQRLQAFRQRVLPLPTGPSKIGSVSSSTPERHVGRDNVLHLPER